MAANPTIILVHGAWADGSCWSKIIPPLVEEGLQVTAVQLPLTGFAAGFGWGAPSDFSSPQWLEKLSRNSVT